MKHLVTAAAFAAVLLGASGARAQDNPGVYSAGPYLSATSDLGPSRLRQTGSTNTVKLGDAIGNLNNQVRAPSRLWQSLIPFWGPTTAAYNNSTPLTYGADFSVEAPFTAVQLILANRGTTAITIPSLAVAASAQMTDTVTPHDANGNALTFSPVTCGGGTTCTLAPSASATREQITVTDAVPLTSFARTDGGTYPLIFTRVAMPANTAYTAGVILPTAITAYNQIPGARAFAAYYAGGDFVSTTGAQALLTTSTAALGPDYNVVVGVRYLSTARTVTVMSCGDSLAAGFVTTSGYNSHGLEASIMLSQRLKMGVSFVAHGFPGTVDTDYLADCAQGVSLLQPQVVTIPSDSPNNLNAGLPGSAVITAAYASMPSNAMQMANTVQAAGALPELETPIPFGQYDLSTKYGAGRQAIGSIIRASTARNMVMLDAQAIVSGYVPAPNKLQVLPASLTATDGAHLNDAGQTLLGTNEANLLMGALQ